MKEQQVNRKRYKYVKEEISKQLAIHLLTPHKEHLCRSPRFWNQYAEENYIPSYYKVCKVFGSWEKMRNYGKKRSYFIKKEVTTQAELISILLPHIHQVQKPKDEWNSYAIPRNLPTVKTILKLFPTWISMRRIVMDQELLDYDMLLCTLRPHIERIRQNPMGWNTYAKKHDLPNQNRIRRYYPSRNTLREDLEKNTRGHLKEEFIKILLPHMEHLKKMSLGQWNEYAAVHKLPDHLMMTRVFGAWEKATNVQSMVKMVKRVIYDKLNDIFLQQQVRNYARGRSMSK